MPPSISDILTEISNIASDISLRISIIPASSNAVQKVDVTMTSNTTGKHQTIRFDAEYSDIFVDHFRDWWSHNYLFFQ